MKGKHLNEALKKLGHSYVRNPFLDGFKHFGADDFIGILDATRVDFVERERGKAGFTETELEYFFGIFQKHDKNHNGWLGPVELEEALTLFGWAPTSRQEQSALVAKIATAHARARGAGVETGVKEGAADMTGKTTFWVLVQLLRLLHDENDRREERELTQLCEELHFSQAEVDQFHHIYRQYARPNPQFITGLQRKVSPTLLAGDSCRSLIRSLGVHVSERDETFRQKLASLDKSGKPDHPSLEFWPFLRLMRWLLDTNFGGINDSVARKMKSKGSEKTGESDNS